MAGWPKIESVHMVCGACDADFSSNGLNSALLSGKIVKVYVYNACNDMAMKWENFLFGKLLFGIKTAPLGLIGPQRVGCLPNEKLQVIWWPRFGHSTCWDSDHFESTMRYFN